MSGDLLQTKLYVPRFLSSLVHRPRLIEKLNQGRKGNLTLVSAPAGFGKTTLVVSWLQKTPFCWLSLDEYDDDPNRFWQYVVAALQTAVPQLGSSLQPILSLNPLPPPPVLLTGLLNELAAQPEPVTLVLDDYHVIGDSAIHDGLNFFLDHMPPQLHLVLLTRADPPLALARLRGHGLLNEIRVADLRFSMAETAVFLREVMDLPLTDKDIAALEARTEGWITGLQLTAVSLKGRTDASQFVQNFSRSHHFILEYLAEEVLQQQPADVQKFLLQTSILPRLCGRLCNAVTGREDSHALLAQLYRQNLFITPLDDTFHWFRYHHLLADLLVNRLHQLMPPEEVRVLQARASRWCADNGRWETAVSHAIASEDWERTADLVSEAYKPLIAEGRVATWQRWLAQIPAAMVQARPALLMHQGWAAFLRGEFQQAAMMLTAARKALSADDLLPEQRALRGELATYLATLAFFREEPAEVIQAAEEALTYLPPEALVRRARAVGALGLGVGLTGDTRRAVALWHEAVEMARLGGNPFLLAHSLEMVADGQLHSGQLHASAATCWEIIALGTQGYVTPLPFVGNGRIRLAAIFLEWGQLLQAEEEMAAGLALVQQGGIGYNALPELCTQARLRQALGDDERALAILRQAEAYYRHSPSRIALITLTACAVQYWLNVGDVATAVSWAEGQHLNEPVPLADLPIIAQEVQQISLARVRRAQQKPEAVLAIFNRLHDQAQAAGRVARVIEMSLLAALAYEMMGETAVALDKLNQVLALTRPEGYVQIFVEAGAPMLHLLRQLPADATDIYVQTLQRAFPESLQVASATLVEPLSLRELEVLQLIAAGLSNKQIMAELTVSLNTVKKHTTHIYGKLGVNGRTQAIVRARELHLI